MNDKWCHWSIGRESNSFRLCMRMANWSVRSNDPLSILYRTEESLVHTIRRRFCVVCMANVCVRLFTNECRKALFDHMIICQCPQVSRTYILYSHRNMGEFIEKINANTFACKHVAFEKRHANEMRTDECWVGDVWNCVWCLCCRRSAVSRVDQYIESVVYFAYSWNIFSARIDSHRIAHWPINAFSAQRSK